MQGGIATGHARWTDRTERIQCDALLKAEGEIDIVLDEGEGDRVGRAGTSKQLRRMGRARHE